MFANRLRLATATGVLGAFGGVISSELYRQTNVHAAEIIPVNTAVTSTHRPSEIMRHGFPGTDNIRVFNHFGLSYDKRNRTAHWVMEHLTADTVRRNEKVQRTNDFKEDPKIHPYFRSTLSDYRGSGFDRGHLAAAANHRRCQADNDETFYLSNMAPQVGQGFNRDSWERLESHVRLLTRTYKNVYVCTGPLYLPRKESDGNLYVHYRVLGDSHVAVPTHFFKVVLGEMSTGEVDMEAYVMPNAVVEDSTPLQSFMVPLETIERAAGLLLFERLDKLRALNGKPPPKQLRIKF